MNIFYLLLFVLWYWVLPKNLILRKEWLKAYRCNYGKLLICVCEDARINHVQPCLYAGLWKILKVNLLLDSEIVSSMKFIRLFSSSSIVNEILGCKLLIKSWKFLRYRSVLRKTANINIPFPEKVVKITDACLWKTLSSFNFSCNILAGYPLLNLLLIYKYFIEFKTVLFKANVYQS